MRDLLPVKERYKEVFGTLYTLFIGAIYCLVVIPIFILALPFLWLDPIAAFIAAILCWELFDD